MILEGIGLIGFCAVFGGGLYLLLSRATAHAMAQRDAESWGETQPDAEEVDQWRQVRGPVRPPVRPRGSFTDLTDKENLGRVVAMFRKRELDEMPVVDKS